MQHYLTPKEQAIVRKMAQRKGVTMRNVDDVMQEVAITVWRFREKHPDRIVEPGLVATIARYRCGDSVEKEVGSNRAARPMRGTALSLDAMFAAEETTIIDTLGVDDDYTSVEGDLIDVEDLIEREGGRMKPVLSSVLVDGLLRREAAALHGCSEGGAIKAVLRFVDRVTPIVREMVAA